MKKIRDFVILSMMFLLVGSFFNHQISRAASAEVEISSESNDVTVGDKVLVKLTIQSDKEFGDFEASLTYNEEVLEYNGGPSIITGGNGFLKIADTNVSDGDTSRKYVLEFTALNVGSSEISFTGNTMVYDFEDGIEMPVSSNSYNVNVKAAETASENAYLKSLKISPSELEPEFDKNVTSYRTKVDNKTEKLIVDAIAEDEKSIVKISGNDSLKEGENKITVTVIAESGADIEYTIDTFREYAKEEDNTTAPTITPGTKHGTFEVAKIDGEIYAIYSGKYKLVEPDSEVNIPEGFKKTSIMISSNTSMTVYAPEGDLDSDFYLIYAENELGEAGFYQYDKIERTMQRYVPDSALGFEDTQDEADTSDTISSSEYRSSFIKAAVVISLLCIICALLLFLLIRQYMKTKGYHDDDLE